MEPEDRSPFLPLFLAAMAFVVLAPVFWMHTELPLGRAITRSYENIDLYQRVYPNFAYGFTQIRQGRLPLWNAGQLCGTPFLANPATGVFQPLNAIGLLLTPERAMAAQAFLGLALMGAFFVLFARGLGVRTTAAVCGGMVYAFCGVTAAAMARPELLATLAWTPLFFWAVHRLASAPAPGAGVLAGLAAALVLLAGAPPVAALLLPLGLLFALFQPRQDPGRGRSLYGPLGITGLVALGLSAVQWWPTMAWLSHLEAPGIVLGRIDLPGQMPTHVTELLTQMLSPSPDLTPRLGYVGIPALLLMPAALTHRVAWRSTLFFGVTVIVAFSLALSARAWGVTTFSPQTFLFPATFGVAVLTALGADRLLARHRDAQTPARWLAWGLFLVVALLVFGAGGALVRGRLLAVFAILAPVFLLRRRPTALTGGILLALLSFVDLRAASVNVFQHPFQDATVALRTYEPVITLAKEQALDGRTAVSAHPLHAGLPANLGMVYPLPCAGGAAIPLTRAQARWWSGLIPPDSENVPGRPLEVSRSAPHLALLNPMAVRVVLATADGAMARGAWQPEGPVLRSLMKTQGIEVLINDAAAPRARWVPLWQPARDLDDAIQQLVAPGFNVNENCVVTASADEHAKLATMVALAANGLPVPIADPVNCQVEDRSPECVRIQVDAPSAGITVLADTDAPGWTAWIDGQRTPMLRVNGLFRGVATPAGPHTIEMRYRPWSVYAGVLTTVFTLMALLAAGIHGAWAALRSR